MKLPLHRTAIVAKKLAVLAASLGTLLTTATLQNTVNAATDEYSPPLRDGHPNQVFWGDTHLHTNLSPDAFTFGNQTITPDIAYRFARGETVVSQSGVRARLDRPLDFLMVSDHAEFLGIFPRVFARDPDVRATSFGKRWISHIENGRPEAVLAEFGIMLAGGISGMTQEDIENLKAMGVDEIGNLDIPESLQRKIWKEVGATADRYNDPGRFTAFIGYEWTSMPGGNNLHRNVLFRDGADKTDQIRPFSSADSGNPEDLWAFLSDYKNNTGGDVIAIPHNANVSNGMMFDRKTLDGEPLTEAYAKLRMQFEPIIEVTQIKGDGETHPFLSPNDEFADYETWDRANLSFTVPKQDAMLEYEYARSALKNGLALGDTLGSNPFQFGMIGSTDSHTGLATGDENNFFGKASNGEPAQDRADADYFAVKTSFDILQWESVASGYAAVWAEENTRESLFDAMRRREVYATTGPRMTVRFFAGWDFEKGDAERHDMAAYGYDHGVPMGAELAPIEASKANKAKDAPSFMVSALKDPRGANLDRIQIVKGWLDADGEVQEKVYNVAASDERRIRRNKLKPVGSTVDIENAAYSNSIGDASLATVWRDPDFDPALAAFYYVRVLEIPTPRWTTYDGHALDSQLPEEVAPVTQERAYTSPIWYQP